MWRNERRLFVTLTSLADAINTAIVEDELFWTRTSADKTATRPRDRVRRARSESGRARMASASRPRPVRPARQVRRFKGPARRRPPPDRREFSLARRAPSAAVRRVRAGWSGGPAVPQGLLRVLYSGAIGSVIVRSARGISFDLPSTRVTEYPSAT